MPSSNPLHIRATNDKKKFFDKANKMMQSPNPPTAKKSRRPWPLRIGKKVSISTLQMEPISAAAFSQPKPMGPMCRIVLANTGTMATAPPNNTAKRSSVNAPNTSLVVNTNRNPSFTLSQVSCFVSLAMAGLGSSCCMKRSPTRINEQTTASVPVVFTSAIKNPPVA